jgi:hypothetical protein
MDGNQYRLCGTSFFDQEKRISINPLTGSDRDDIDLPAAHNSVNDAKATDTKTPQSGKFVLQRFSRMRFGEYGPEGRPDFLLEMRMQTSDEPGYIIRDPEFVNRRLH